MTTHSSDMTPDEFDRRLAAGWPVQVWDRKPQGSIVWPKRLGTFGVGKTVVLRWPEDAR